MAHMAPFGVVLDLLSSVQTAAPRWRRSGGRVMRRGLWCCSRCEYWWIWETDEGVKRLDRVCRKCNHRVQAMLSRRPGNRGRRRTDSILEYPAYRPVGSIRTEQKRRNRRRTNIKKHEDSLIGFDSRTFVRSSRVAAAKKRWSSKSQGDPTLDQEDE